VAAVSNEGRELTVHRIETFRLDEFIDFFISSCFVHFRKPDTDIYALACDVAHVRPEEVAYLEDRQMFVEVARKMGFQTIRHTGYDATVRALAALGLSLD